MRTKLRAFGLALISWASLASPILAGPQPDQQDAVARFVRAHLSHDNVLALLLLLLSEEDARVYAQLEALYDAGYVSTAPTGSYPIDRYLAGALAARYRSEVPGDVFSAMLEYQKLVAREARQDRLSTPARLQRETLRIVSRLASGRVDQFALSVGDWLAFLRGSVSDLRESELAMIQLQSLVAQRQVAIQLVTNMLIAMNEAMKTIAGNMGGGGGSGAGAASLSESISDDDADVPCHICSQ